MAFLTMVLTFLMIILSLNYWYLKFLKKKINFGVCVCLRSHVLFFLALHRLSLVGAVGTTHDHCVPATLVEYRPKAPASVVLAQGL